MVFARIKQLIPKGFGFLGRDPNFVTKVPSKARAAYHQFLAFKVIGAHAKGLQGVEIG